MISSEVRKSRRHRIENALLMAAFVTMVCSWGCASFSDAAHRTKGTLAVGALVAVEAWQEVDLDRQRAILDHAATREIYDRNVAEYRAGEQARAVRAIRGARRSFAVLSNALKAYDAGSGSKRDVGAALSASFAAAAELIAALQASGVKVDNFLAGVK
jgi:hypothetical protein